MSGVPQGAQASENRPFFFENAYIDNFLLLSSYAGIITQFRIKNKFLPQKKGRFSPARAP
jgi:hypothetical protein